MAKEYLSANPPYVVVQKGDTLSEIAQKYASRIAGTGIYGTGGKLATLTKINDITNANYIVVGQKIILKEASGTSATKKKTNTTNTPTIKAFGLQSDTNRSVYATWTWSKTNTEEYRIYWQYDTGDGVWFKGEDSTTKDKQCIYNAPENANKVRFKVLPVSKKRKVNGKETAYWTASWSAIKTYEFKNNPPVAPTISDSNVTIEADNKITIELRNIDTSIDGLNASTIQFQIYRDSSKLVHTAKVNVNNLGIVSYTWSGAQAGYEYSVRARSVRGGLYSEWSDLTDEKPSAPAKPSKIIDCYPLNDTTMELTWSGVKNAVSYTIQYIELPDDVGETNIPSGQTYFDVFESQIKTVEVPPLNAGENPPTFKSISDLTIGKKYCFRVRANGSDQMSSDWTAIRTGVLGKQPGIPTTWSSSNKVMVGEELTLYWIHNAEDESEPTQAQILFAIETLEGTTHYTHTVNYGTSDVTEEEQVESSSGVKDWVTNKIKDITGYFTANTSYPGSSNDDENPVSKYVVQTANFEHGATIKWSVRTKGVDKDFSEESQAREILILDKPSVDMDLKGNIRISTEEDIDLICTGLPITVNIDVQSTMQEPIGYHISVISRDRYESIDDIGNRKIVNENESVFERFVDTTENPLVFDITAKDIDLENGADYTVSCTVALDSGLSVTESDEVRVFWDDNQYQPNAEISIDPDRLTASIRPFCEDEEGNLIENVLLSVYRREFDGTFVELIKDVKNTAGTFVTDPHPALDYARYRIVAKDESTGGIGFYDVPGYPVNEKAVVLQWDEAWSNFDSTIESWTEEDLGTEFDTPVWSGSILKLPYNIDVSDSNSRDVELVNYIGRKHSVSYYGTYIGQTATWSVAVPKSDTDTLAALRRLAIWMGDVYVREPSGSGYWASVDVSFSQTHCELTIPVSLNITRVEGGV